MSPEQLFSPNDNSGPARTHRKALEIAGASGAFVTASAIFAAIRWHNARTEKLDKLEQSTLGYNQKIEFLSTPRKGRQYEAIMEVTAGALTQGTFTPNSLLKLTGMPRNKADFVFGTGMSFLMRDRPCVYLEEKNSNVMLSRYTVEDEFNLIIYENWDKLGVLQEYIAKYNEDFTLQVLRERLPAEIRELKDL
jgi:hypothetical protein